MLRRRLEIEVSAEDQKQLRQILRAGMQQVRVVLRALALEQLSEGMTAPAVAKMVHLTVRRDKPACSREWKSLTGKG